MTFALQASRIGDAGCFEQFSKIDSIVSVVGDGSFINKQSFRDIDIGPTFIHEQNYSNAIRITGLIFNTKLS